MEDKKGVGLPAPKPPETVLVSTLEKGASDVRFTKGLEGFEYGRRTLEKHLVEELRRSPEQAFELAHLRRLLHKSGVGVDVSEYYAAIQSLWSQGLIRCALVGDRGNFDAGFYLWLVNGHARRSLVSLVLALFPWWSHRNARK